MAFTRRGLLGSLGVGLAVAGAGIAGIDCVNSSPPPVSPGADAALPPDDSALPPGTDSGTDSAPTPDSSVSPSDASAPDATDAAAPAVSVLVTGFLGPEQGVTVVFDDANGNVLGTATTDATGSASSVVAAGSQATVVLTSGGNLSLRTYVGVEPGDVITVIDPTGPAVFASITVPFFADAGNFAFGAASGRCGFNGFTQTAVSSLVPGCYNLSGVFPILAFATDQAPPGTTYFATQRGNIAPLDGGPTSVQMTGPWSTTLDSETVLTTNVPDDGGAPSLTVSEVVGGVGIPQDYQPLDAGTFGVHPGFADYLLNEADYYGSSGQAGLCQGVVTESAPSSSGVATLDLSNLLPAITNVMVDGTNPAQPVTTWSAAASLASSSGISVTITWGPGSWTFVARPTATSITAPALPASLGLVPDGGAPFKGVTMSAVGGLSSYAVLRQGADSYAGNSLCTPPILVPPPTTAALSFTVWGPGIDS